MCIVARGSIRNLTCRLLLWFFQQIREHLLKIELINTIRTRIWTCVRIETWKWSELYLIQDSRQLPQLALFFFAASAAKFENESVVARFTFYLVLQVVQFLVCDTLYVISVKNESPTAIFSQPIFLSNMRTVLFEKETWQAKPPLESRKCSLRIMSYWLLFNVTIYNPHLGCAWQSVGSAGVARLLTSGLMRDYHSKSYPSSTSAKNPLLD